MCFGILVIVTSYWFSVGPVNVAGAVENGIIKKKCPKCQEEFPHQEAVKCHMMVGQNLIMFKRGT